MRQSSLLIAVLFSLAVSCGGEEDNKKTDGANNWRIDGVVSASSGMGAASAQSGAQVRATIDRNGDGTPEVLESTTTDGDGRYSLGLAAEAGDRVVVRYRTSTTAPLFRTFKAAPGAHVVLNVQLAEMQELTCTGSQCALDGGALRIDGLPEGLAGSGRLFNPVTEAEQFPGDFSDSDGNLLLSGVFSTVELEDDSSDPVTSLALPAELRMRMPQDTWPIIVDTTDGNDTIDVPLYSFDEVLGTWVRDGEGYLEDGDGNVIAPALLGSIRDGSYTGIVVARGMVSHFSSWNVDWPVESHGCLRGRVLGKDAMPAKGATVTVRGLTYTGSSAPQAVGDDGTFCIQVMRSEGAGEDVDQDGINGETQKVAVRVAHQGTLYDFGEAAAPVAQGSCDGSGCADLGDLTLSDSKALAAALCSVSGTVRNRVGQPVSGATVFGTDETVDDATFEALCFSGASACSFVATSATDGSYSITAPVLDLLSLFSMWNTTVDASTEGTLYGERTVRGCPAAVVDITLDQGYFATTLTVGVSGDVISWSPAPGTGSASWFYVVVSSAAGDAKWMIMQEGGTFSSPVTYGSVPAGAAQVLPATGAPAGLAAGDEVAIHGSYTDTDGYMWLFSGTAVVP